jgi:hypothetical protein
MTPSQAKAYNNTYIRERTSVSSVTTDIVATAIDQAIDSDNPDYSIHTITYSSTPVLDGNNGTNFKITVTGAALFALNNLVVGKDYYLTIKQDATGGRQITFPAASVAPLGAFSSGTILASSSAANAEDDVRIRYDGTKYRIYLDRNVG